MENTPFYFYDLNVLDDTLNTVLNCTESDNFHIHYAIKANNNKKILEIIILTLISPRLFLEGIWYIAKCI